MSLRCRGLIRIAAPGGEPKVSVFLANEQSEEVDVAALRHLAEVVLAEEGYPAESEVTILLVNDEEMADYNEKFLGRSGPTDVLAFPVESLVAGKAPDADPQGPPLMIGDVLVSPAYVRRQAADLGVTYEDEMALMVTHGLLHLIGYDHEDDNEAAHMERREAELLGLVGRGRR